MTRSASSGPYIEAAEEALESAFQSFEVVNALYAREGSAIRKPRLSKTSLNVAKVMMKQKYIPGKGLGKRLQGITNPLIL